MSAGFGEEVDSALSLIADAKLPHPSGPLLQHFILEALNPRLPARYILGSCRPDENQHAILLEIVSSWKYIVGAIFEHSSAPPPPNAADQSAIRRRDGDRCCITGKAGRLWDPLIVVPVLPLPMRWSECEPRIHEMLGAFFTPSYRDWWLAYIRDPQSINPLHSHWLVRKSAAHVFKHGFLKFDRLQPSMIEYKIKRVRAITNRVELDIKGYYPVLGDHSRSGLQTVDARFLGTHARFAPNIRWLQLANDFALNEDPQVTPPTIRSYSAASKILQLGQRGTFSFKEFLTSTCIAIWRKFPQRIRMGAYKILRMIGHHIYGSNPLGPAQRLPFGLYLKDRREIDLFQNEFNALKMVRQYTTAPVPRPIDVVSGSEELDGYLLISRVPGVPFAICMERLSDRDLVDIISQMREYISQLRAIPKKVSPNFAICNTLGQACRDTRVRDGDPIGPFVDEAAFSQLLRNPDEPSRRGHSILFTHADLNARNILVDQVTQPDGTKVWKVTGIVDWESAGFYPEYWEYTRSLFEGFRYTERVRDMLHELFKVFGDYSREFDVEKRSWEEGIG